MTTVGKVETTLLKLCTPAMYLSLELVEFQQLWLVDERLQA
jgi:hypothetical protein